MARFAYSANHKDIGTMYLAFALMGGPGRRAAVDRRATTLEWTLSSPPPFHQFSELPLVK
jgi:cytochrome c oxidase subunit 1